MGDVSENEEKQLYYEQALFVLESCTPRNELLLIASLTTLGDIAIDQGQVENGTAHWKHILDILRQIHSLDHPKIAKQPERLGDVYYEEIKDCTEGLRYFSESLIYRANSGDQHSRILQLEYKIGKVYAEKGDFTLAVESYQRVLKLKEQHLPLGHIDISTSIDMIAK
ncbi:unnamed protein product, partial [Rotaria sp. Silwood1]